jgi:hypothetical protein
MNNSAQRQSDGFVNRFAQSLLTAWVFMAAILFMIANRAGQVQMFFWNSWQDFIFSLIRIAPAKYLWDMCIALGGVALFSAVCVGVGLVILKNSSISSNQLAHGLTAFLTGEIILSVLLLTLASLKLLSPLVTGIILAAGLALGGRTLGEFLKNAPRTGLPSADNKIVFWLAVGVVLSGLMYSSARLGYDATAEYFTNAKIIASHGGVLFYPINGFFTSALHSTILFTATMQIFGDQSARLLSWVNGAVILLLGLALGRETGLSSRAQLYFSVLLLTSTAFVDLLGDGKVELISSAPLLCGVYWMLRSRQTPSQSIFLLIGLLLGFSVISRPYNIFLVPTFAIFFLLTWVAGNIRLHGVPQGIHLSLPVLWMLPCLLALGAFHLWQNQMWLGSPIAPLTFAQEFDSSDWQWQFDISLLPLLKWLYPLTVTFLNTPQSLGVVSPLFIGILPFLALRDVRRRLQISPELRDVLLSTLFTLALWVALFFTVMEIRYVLTFWGLLFLVAAQIMEAAQAALERQHRTLILLLSALLLGFISLRTTVISLTTYSPIDSSGQAHCSDAPMCAFFKTVNKTAGTGDRVFVLHAYRYYLRPDLFACSSQRQEYPLLQALAARNSPAEFWTETYRQGFRYLTYEKNFATFHTRFGEIPFPDRAPDWLEIRIIAETNNEIAYALEAKDPPFSPQTTCRRDEKKLWHVIESPAK